MAVVAGVRCTELCRYIRPRYSKAVVMPLIDHHVGADGHMAGCAANLRRYTLVPAVRGDLIFIRGMALQANAVARGAQSCGMRFVAIAAGDAGREHLALL